MKAEATPNGIKCTGIVNGFKLTQIYVGYSRLEALKQFRQYIRQQTNN